ncbi:MAG: flagellar basal-body MS-ring/collar protein FliF, partial [Armatimonadota bacterium]
VYEMRIALAREGLPASGQLGFEIFDRSGLPGTQFANKVNYQRALQGELSRTIGAMAEVLQVRVHLVLPEENLFGEPTKASASVVITPRAGAEITREMTSAIAHIVASAAAGIKPGEVTVADNSGHLLRGPDSEGSVAGLNTGQFEIQRQFEDRLGVRLQSMLDAVLGPSQSVVRVQAQFDFDSAENKQEIVSPVASGKGLVTSEKLRQETYSGTATRNGAVGAAPNMGLAASVGSTPGGAYLNRDETRQFEYSRRSSSLVKAPGTIKALTLAAIIDESLPASAETQVRDVLTAAAGIDRQRGDVITVRRMKMKTAELAQTQEKDAVAADKSERQQRLVQIALRGGLSVVAAGLIFMSVLMAARQLRQPPGASESADVPPATVEALPPPDTVPVPAPLAPPEASPQPAPNVSEELNQRIREQLRDLTRDDSGAVADRLLVLLQEKSA